MRKFLIATHGTFASGIKTSLELIAGPCGQVYTLDAYLEGGKTIEDELDDLINSMDESDELVVLTDLAGGSVTNRILVKTPQPAVHLVAGVNLPLLLDVVLADEQTPLSEIIEPAIARAKEQILDVKQWMLLNGAGTD